MKRLLIIILSIPMFFPSLVRSGTGATNMMMTNEINRTPVYEMPEVVVTANRNEVPVSQVGSSVTIINAGEIGKKGPADVKDLLTGVPGLTVSQNGGFGGISQIFIRGTKPGSTLVLIDGVPVNDPISTDESFDFANLTTDNIERIEIVRGPASMLYGSGAMGGIINIITKNGKGGPTAEMNLMDGSFNTLKLGGTVNGRMNNWNYSLAVSRIQSDGYSQVLVTNIKNAPERDGYKNTSVSGKTGISPFQGAWFELLMRYDFANADIDNAAFDDDINHTETSENALVKAAFNHVVARGWDYHAAASYYSIKREDLNYPDFAHTDQINSWFFGGDLRVELMNNFHFQDIDSISLGYDYHSETGSSHYYSTTYGPFTNDINGITKADSGLFLENQINLFGIIHNTSGIRLDINDASGNVLNVRSSLRMSLTNFGFTAKGNMATGTKDPSLYQLYSSYGNPHLRTEKSLGFDAGFEQSLAHGRLLLETVYFQNRFSNMIDYDSVDSKYTNIGKALSEGVEASLMIKPFVFLTVQANYTYTWAIDTDSGKYLLGIPMHKASCSVEIEPVKGLDLSPVVTYYGSRYSYPYELMPAYFLVNMNLCYKINKFKIFGNVANLLNSGYQEVQGYNNGGIMFNTGMSISL